MFNIPALLEKELSEGKPLPFLEQDMCLAFLPIAYGDAQAIGQTREDILAYFQRHDWCSWQQLQKDHADRIEIQQGKLFLKRGLRDWLSEQGVNPDAPQAVEAFNRGRMEKVGLPSMEEMLKIYPITAGMEEGREETKGRGGFAGGEAGTVPSPWRLPPTQRRSTSSRGLKEDPSYSSFGNMQTLNQNSTTNPQTAAILTVHGKGFTNTPVAATVGISNLHPSIRDRAMNSRRFNEKNGDRTQSIIMENIS